MTISEKPRRYLRRTAAGLLTGAVVLTLGACESALSPDYSSKRGDSESLYQSLLVRQALRGAYGDKTLNSGDLQGTAASFPGMVRVDSEGPTTAAADTQPSVAKASLIGRAAAQLHQEEPVVNLTLQDVIARTVQHSLQIKVESYNPAIKESQIQEAMANFDTVVFGSSQSAYNDDPQNASTLANGQNWTNQVGVKRILPTGTQIQASTGFAYRDVAQTLSGKGGYPSTFWTANENLQLVQPLLKGFGEDVNQATIYLAQRDHRISLSQFKQQVMTQVADVETAYLALVQARTNVEVLERLVVASEQTYIDVQAREHIDATKASVSQALSALQSRRADLHDAQTTYRNASDALKTLLNDPELDINSNALINPVDRPTAQPVKYDVLECIATGLRQRPEMQQVRLQLERADIILKVAKNDLLPQVNLTLALQNNGTSRITGAQGGDLGNAYIKTINPSGFIDTTVGISFQFPLGNREAEAALARRLNERRQLFDNMELNAQKIAQDIKAQLRQVYSNYDVIDYRDAVRRAAADEFQGILDLENIRTRSPEFLQLKLDSQARLASAEQQLTQTLINYNLAVMKLEQAKGTLLEYDRISLDKAPPAVKNDLDEFVRNPFRSILNP
jgi:HAE1 family hydrophobic/amphiphilic exporter-1